VLGATRDLGGEALLGGALPESVFETSEMYLSRSFAVLATAFSTRCTSRARASGTRGSRARSLKAWDSEAVGERRVDLEAPGDALAAPRASCAPSGPHVVDAVAQLDEEHADVARHRDAILREVLGLAIFLRGEVDLAELVTPSTSGRHSLPNSRSMSVRRRERVLDDVVEETGADARGVETQLGDDARHRRGWMKVRVRPTSAFWPVCASSCTRSALDHFRVRRPADRPVNGRNIQSLSLVKKAHASRDSDGMKYGRRDFRFCPVCAFELYS